MILARLPKNIRVTNFEKYQHGGEDAKYLPWVKLYVTTLADVDLMALPTPTFKLFICLLLIARRTDNRIAVGGQDGCKRLAKTLHLTTGAVTQSVQELLREGLVKPYRVSTEAREILDDVNLRTRAGASSLVSSSEVGVEGPTAQELVKEYVDHAASLSLVLPRQVKGAAAQKVGQLLREGIDPALIRQALRLLNEKGLNPASLPSLVVEAQRGAQRNGKGGSAADIDRISSEMDAA